MQIKSADYDMVQSFCIAFPVTKITINDMVQLKRWLQLRFDYDTTTIRLRRIARQLPFDAIQREQKNNMSIFHRSRVVVVS